MVNELDPAALYHRWDVSELSFQTTDDLEAVTDVVGQPRAVAAIEFGIGMARDGYNVFALGVPGVGKETVVREFLDRRAAGRPAAPDLCYAHNFDDPHKPRLLHLPSGRGTELHQAMVQLVEELRTALASALESEEYQSRRQVIEDEFKEQPAQALTAIEERAQGDGLALLRTPMGMAFAPVRDGEVVSGEDFDKLPKEEQETIQSKVNAYQEEVQRTLRQIPKWNRERHEKVRELNREVTELAAGHLIDEVRAEFEALPEVVEFLDAVKRDVIEHPDDFVKQDAQMPAVLMGALAQRADDGKSLRRYEVNVLVDSSGMTGAPVVFEEHPSYDNLIGRIEHVSQLGALLTDHNLIKAGALHRANGGFLVLDAYKLLRSPYAWEALKRVLQAGRLRVESLGQALSLIGTVSLEPEPLALDLQVILLGEPMVYYLLCAYDPEFPELFKVAADFDHQMDASPENRRQYVQLIAGLVRKGKLRPFDRDAVARVVEHSARLAGDQRKLSARLGVLEDVMREADYWANDEAVGVVARAHVQKAIDAQIRRADRIREHIQEEIARGTIKIDTEGRQVGQLNGLSVMTLGNFPFGHPTRISARVRLGTGDVVDIEREVELGGPIHSKGVLILAGYLGTRYVPEQPLSLSASLVFEQSYGGVEGDSASSAELFTLLSAIAEIPLRQDMAVTGSVNQHGQIQAVGGVNEKIEGFFDVCRARGLTGSHGVLMPAANVEHLMLREEIVDAVAQGTFHIYPIETVDEGLELLSGLPAGERDAEGRYPEQSFNAAVEQRLIALAEARRSFKENAEKQHGD